MSITKINNSIKTTDFLGLPITSISDLKKSPKKLFDESNNTKKGIFVFNRNKPEGVILSLNHYKSLIKKNEDLQSELDQLNEKLLDFETDKEALRRIKEQKRNPQRLFTEEEVLGHQLDNVKLDDNDGWE